MVAAVILCSVSLYKPYTNEASEYVIFEEHSPKKREQQIPANTAEHLEIVNNKPSYQVTENHVNNVMSGELEMQKITAENDAKIQIKDAPKDEKSNNQAMSDHNSDVEQSNQRKMTIRILQNVTVSQHTAKHKDLSVLYKESQDIYELLPKIYLPNYKSFCWHDTRQKFQCLASVYLAGMPKCGTTDLFRKMMKHPKLTYQTHADGEIPKEYHYWARSRVARNKWLFADPNRRSGKERFSSFLRGTGSERVKNDAEMQIVDGTPSLFWDLAGWDKRYPGMDEPPYSNGDLIYSVTPDAKIIGILRNPVERLYSEYLYFWLHKTEVRTPQSFHVEVIKEIAFFNSCLSSKTLRSCCYSSRAMNSVKIRLELGVYVCFVRDFFDAFGNNLLLLTLEEYHSNPFETLTKVFNHVKVSIPDDLHTYFEDSDTRNVNTDLKIEVGEILPETMQMLNDFYGPYNAQLAHLLQNTKYQFNT